MRQCIDTVCETPPDLYLFRFRVREHYLWASKSCRQVLSYTELLQHRNHFSSWQIAPVKAEEKLKDLVFSNLRNHRDKSKKLCYSMCLCPAQHLLESRKMLHECHFGVIQHLAKTLQRVSPNIKKGILQHSATSYFWYANFKNTVSLSINSISLQTLFFFFLL